MAEFAKADISPWKLPGCNGSYRNGINLPATITSLSAATKLESDWLVDFKDAKMKTIKAMEQSAASKQSINKGERMSNAKYFSINS